MTIAYSAGAVITGLSSDTKPTTASNGTIFIETDTGSRFIINSGTWTQLVGGNLDGLTDVDLTTAAPTNNQVLTYTTTGTKWVPATPPGSGGGEANTLSSEGTGTGTLPGTKVGSALGIKSLKQGTNITLTNNANDVTISATGGGSVTTSSTDTFTNKTINPTSNILPYLNSYSYTIYIDGGAVKARNNKTGAITSNANLDPLITTILASGDPVVEVQTGTYNLSAGFTGWDMVTDALIFMHRGCKIWVPNGYTGDVFKFSSGSVNIFGAKIIGGEFNEIATAANDWNFIAIKPTSGKGVIMCQVRDMIVWRAKRVIHVNTTDLSWGSDNVFDNIEAEACEYFAEFAHTGTWTPDASGLHQNTFNKCFLQATTASGGNALVQGGIINVMGDGNMFINCTMWDFGSRNVSASTMTIHANGRATQIIGGLCTYQLFTDAGTLTKISNRHSGTVHKGTANFYDNLTVIDPTNTASLGLLKLYKANPTATNFLDWGIDFEGHTSTLVKKTWARFICATDDYTEGSEDTWFGVEYMLNGVRTTRGMFYNNGIGMGPSGTRAYINASGMTGNRTFTLPDAGAQIATISAAQTLTNKTISDLKENWVGKSTTYTMTDTDYGIYLTGTSTYTITLPAVSGRTGKIFQFVKTGASGTVTIDGNASETINGATTQTMSTQYGNLKIICDGTAWFTIG